MEATIERSKLPTTKELLKASYNELRKMAKEAKLNLGRGVTADAYRMALMHLSELDAKAAAKTNSKKEELKKEVKSIRKEVEGLVMLSSLPAGSQYKFKSSARIYLIEEKTEQGIKIKTDDGRSWTESKLERQVLQVTQ